MLYGEGEYIYMRGVYTYYKEGERREHRFEYSVTWPQIRALQLVTRAPKRTYFLVLRNICGNSEVYLAAPKYCPTRYIYISPPWSRCIAALKYCITAWKLCATISFEYSVTWPQIRALQLVTRAPKKNIFLGGGARCLPSLIALLFQ